LLEPSRYAFWNHRQLVLRSVLDTRVQQLKIPPLANG